MYKKKHIDYDIISVDPIPTKSELSDYYAQKYYQESDGKKSTYDSTYTADELAYKKLESSLTLQGIKENIATAAMDLSLLDLGCGEGFLVKGAAVEGYLAKGVDYSSFGVDKWNPDIVNLCEFGDIYAFLEDTISQKRKFNVCVLRNVLEHVIDPAGLLERLSCILEKDGIISITVPNDYSDLQKLAMSKGFIDREFWFAPPDHLYYFNTKNIGPFMKKNGFDVIDMYSSFPIDYFLFHSGSNYILDSKKGKEAHFARISIDLLLAGEGMDKYLALYRAMANCGIGRDFTVVIKAS